MKKIRFLNYLRKTAAIMGVLCCLLQPAAVIAAPREAARATACAQEGGFLRAFRAQSSEDLAFIVSDKNVGVLSGVSAKKADFYSATDKKVEVLSGASAKKDVRRISSSSVRLSKKAYSYDGREKKPSVTVKYGGKTLKKGRDYSVSYRNNIKRGKAKVIVNAKGRYYGTVTMSFKIK